VPADIGRVVAFLASPEGEWIHGEEFLQFDCESRLMSVSGQIIPLNGGARV
jgi:hypothetical protein